MQNQHDRPSCNSDNNYLLVPYLDLLSNHDWRENNQAYFSNSCKCRTLVVPKTYHGYFHRFPLHSSNGYVKS